MNFVIGDTFTDGLARLTNAEQKAVKTTVFDLQLDPTGPGLQFHKIDGARDTNFWSLRVNQDIRLIVHRTSATLLLAYVGHHDAAYKWAEVRKLERHPTTGAMQLVEIEQLKRTLRPDRKTDEIGTVGAAKPTLLSHVDDSVLLGCGVPAEWLDAVRTVTEDTLFEVAAHLPAEAADALLELAVGETPKARKRSDPTSDPFSHPDAQHRFRPITDRADLEKAIGAASSGRPSWSGGRALASLTAFETMWTDLRRILVIGEELRGWGAQRGFTSMRFQINDTGPRHIEVNSSSMSAPRRISKGEFVKVYAIWSDYRAGRIGRRSVAAISQNSSYIFAILKRYDDSAAAPPPLLPDLPQ